MRQYSIFDQVCMHIDQGMRSLFCKAKTPHNPASRADESELSDKERRHAAALMRINHVGEICAQALYQGQAITARDPATKAKMQHAADEEYDHLAWCQSRLDELNSHVSYLNPLWYFGSLGIGVAAGIAGDKWSLGFLAETEHQVVKHLESHLDKLPEHDYKSRAIVTQMKIDETKHQHMAIDAGAATLPKPVNFVMGCLSKVMTTTAYWV